MSRTRTRRMSLWTAAGVVSLLALKWGVPAAGDDNDLQRCRDVCMAAGGDVAKREALEDLKAMDTSGARTALAQIADGSDRMAAVLALHTIGRAGYSGAADKLRAVFEDGDRAHAVRVAAFQAWARLAAANGSSWGTIEAYAEEHADEGSQLLASCVACRAVLFPE